MDTKINELQQKSDDVTNLTKVSIVQTLNKQLNEKSNYIQILESQLEKLRNTKKSSVILEGISPRIKYVKNTTPNQEAQKVEVPVLIHVSNVMLWDKQSNKADQSFCDWIVKNNSRK